MNFTTESVARYALFLLRVVSGFMISVHGFQKLFGVLGGMLGHGEKAAFLSMYWFAGVLELAGGLLILVGLLTKISSFILSGEMAFAYFIVHAPRGFWPILNNGERPVLYCFIFLYLAAAGAGAFSLDQSLCKKGPPRSGTA